MNNIEILEDYIEALRKPKPFKYTNEQKAQAIENLIQRNKELKDTNQKLYELCQGKAMQEFINNECDFIPKSKIKEKIEFIKTLNEKIYYEENVISILQELLEEGE